MKINTHIIRKEWLVQEPVLSLSLDWMQGEVHLYQSTEQHVRIIQRASVHFPIKRCFTTRYQQGSLHIGDGRSKSFPIGIHFQRTSLAIGLPPSTLEQVYIRGVGTRFIVEDAQINHFECRCTSGQLHISGYTQQLSLRMVGSHIKSQNLTAENVDIKGTSSLIQLTGQFSHIQSRTTGRTLSIHSATMPQSVNSIATGCSVNLRVPNPNEGFRLQCKHVGGALQSEFPLQLDRGEHIYGNASVPIHAQVRGGRFTIGTYSPHSL
ncbi:DUF4097 domain-containing protein [Paenibacillus sp. ACRSA]|uniref:DUF4097 family beta strand repeat-containing protein n=1 Tax=Paenibacillus sp. ACRSA TaxID=2918211 RepID=UPI001EF4EBB2|nr:DUF4097 family beta strand repeat-containing protein [Paenibacillus sp. ACRSA]MCG7376830.1 DUF4097 domain-containing protein [Paenibacillus sp. ACRSA]